MTGWFFTLLMAAGPANALRPQRLEDGDIVGDGGAAHVEDAAESGILHLHVAGLTGKLHRAQHVHGDAGGADRMALGLEAAGGVDRQPAILLGPDLGDGSRALAALGESREERRGGKRGGQTWRRRW